MIPENSSEIQISCEITLIQNIFNPLSRLVVTIILIIIGLLFIIFPIVNIAFNVTSIFWWVIGMILIPTSFMIFLRPEKSFSLYKDANPISIKIVKDMVITNYEGRSYERSIESLKVKKGLFGVSLIRDNSGYCDILVSVKEMPFEKLIELISYKKIRE